MLRDVCLKTKNFCQRYGILIGLISCFFVGPKLSLASEKLLEDIKALSYDKVFLLAEAGDMNAQYWFGDRIYNGAFDDWRSFDYKKYWNLAADQGHALATYRLHDSLHNNLHDSSEDFKIQLARNKTRLINLSNRDDPYATDRLAYIYKLEATKHWVKTGEQSSLLRAKVGFYTLKASKLGSREATYFAASYLKDGAYGIEENPSKALNTLELGWKFPPDPAKPIDGLDCMSLEMMTQFYAGDFDGSISQENSVAVNEMASFKDELKYLQTLKESRNHECFQLMMKLAEKVSTGGKVEDYLEAYIVAEEALLFTKNYNAEHSVSLDLDDIYFALAEYSFKLADYKNSFKNISKIERKDWLDVVFFQRQGSSIHGLGYQVCEKLDISFDKCQSSYLAN